MRFKEFERAALEAYEEIPEAYLEGIDGLVVSREAIPHPDLPDVYTLGECVTEEYASDWGGPDTTRSVVVLYWGSFRMLAVDDDGFDWDGELWETLTHELRHHLESLAGDDALEGVDYAMDERFKRHDGRDFDPWYYQHGEEVGRGVFRVEDTWYIELAWRVADFEGVRWITFGWEGRSWRVPRPEELGDVHFVRVKGPDIVGGRRAGDLELVLVRRRSWWEDAKRLVGTYTPVVRESDAVAEPLPATG